MVRIITTAGVIIFGIASIYSAPVRRDIAAVKTDIEALKTQVVALDDKIKTFGDGAVSLDDAADINDISLTYDDALKQVTLDVQTVYKTTGIASTEDATSILDTITSYKSQILDALSTLVEKKKKFGASSDVITLVHTDLYALYIDNQSFEQALILACPEELKPSGSALASSIDAAFATALAAYPSISVPKPTVIATPSTAAPPTTIATTIPQTHLPPPTLPLPTQAPGTTSTTVPVGTATSLATPPPYPAASPTPTIPQPPSGTDLTTRVTALPTFSLPPIGLPLPTKPLSTDEPTPSSIDLPPALQKCFEIQGKPHKQARCFLKYIESQFGL